MRFRHFSWLLAVSAAVSIVSCSSSDGGIADEPCTVEAPSECPSPAPGYAKDVAPIFDKYCGQCHTGIGEEPWSLLDYDHVVDWAELVRADVLDCSMPPKESPIRVTNAQRLTILQWIRCNTPP